MSNSAKYIVVESMGLECPIIFSNLLTHKEEARGRKVISAGFVSFDIVPDPNSKGYESLITIEVNTYGKSVSLDIGSRGYEDDELIEKFILNK